MYENATNGRRRHGARRLFVFLSIALAAQAASAIEIAGDFAPFYTFSDLGAVPDLPVSYGGLAILRDDPNTLLIGGQANTASGLLYTITLTRDVDRHVTGFACTLAPYGTVGDYNDGGVVFGPGNVLFTARWPINELGQTRPGSTDEDRVDALATHGVPGDSSISALNFVPAGFGGAGQMKIVTYGGGSWYTMPFSADGAGSFDLGTATLDTTIGGGPEGFVYVSGANPGFGVDSILVSEYAAGTVGTYAIDGNGTPDPSTRRDFITGLSGAEGATIDPLTGDFLFSTFGGSNHVIVVKGFTSHDGIFQDGFDGPGDVCP